ncbi:SURF1 family protein [Pseudogemmobacter sonorensis]|uniref:SURF1 family protein n=1 Tax=Pseudogemmobacter sonorensis TaxID=2989681 RepID=UPI0036A4782B
MSAEAEAPPRPRPLWLLAVLGGGALAASVALTGLGIWQVQRLGWKLALIDRIEARVHAAPAALPPPPDWGAASAERDEYRRVAVRGVFRHDLETLVQALTEEGGGFWVLTPLDMADGGVILVNRGFVPPERRDPASRPESAPADPVEITGLLRMTEPGGGFLRENDPGADRWFSRDVAAIAQARGLERVAPWFLDAEAGEMPRGGLTVVRFSNNHLSYALTWFALALGTVAAAIYVLRDEWRMRRRPQKQA